jgi:hypothetical protein
MVAVTIDMPGGSRQRYTTQVQELDAPELSDE